MRSYEAADLGVRIGARAIDTIILVVAFSAVLGVVAVTSDGSAVGTPLWSGLAAAAYEVLFVWKRGATPGKSILHLRVVDESTEGDVALPSAVARWAVLGAWALFPNTGAVGLISFVVTVAVVVMVVTRPDRRGPHDLAAGTRVVRV